MLHIEVVFVDPQGVVFHGCCVLPAGSTLADGLKQSGLFNQYPEAADYPTGIFSTRCTPTTLLTSGDRIEVYRPLRCDPKILRREKARRKKT